MEHPIQMDDPNDSPLRRQSDEGSFWQVQLANGQDGDDTETSLWMENRRVDASCSVQNPCCVCVCIYIYIYTYMDLYVIIPVVPHKAVAEVSE